MQPARTKGGEVGRRVVDERVGSELGDRRRDLGVRRGVAQPRGPVLQRRFRGEQLAAAVTATLRANEMNCQAIFKGTKVDGVYDKDPKKHADAVRYDNVTYDEVLQKHLNVMDASAIMARRSRWMRSRRAASTVSPA